MSFYNTSSKSIISKTKLIKLLISFFDTLSKIPKKKPTYSQKYQNLPLPIALFDYNI